MSDPKDQTPPQSDPDVSAEASAAPEQAANAADGTMPWNAGAPGDDAGGPDAAAPAGTGSAGTGPETTGPEARIAELEAEVADLKDRLLRAVADAENTRKRAERDKQDASKYAMTSFARDVLSVGDNMRRAIDTLSDEDRTAAPEPVRNLIEGVEMTEREFLSVMERNGVKAINPHGEKFDPNLHQAMFEAPDPSKPAGTVMEVVATGYVIGDRLLRPAMVGVSKGGPAAAPAGSPAADASADTGSDASGNAGDAGTNDGGADKANPGSTIDTKA